MFFTRQMMMVISATHRAIIGGPELPMIWSYNDLE
jgi:hypothetical protein